MFNRKMLGRVVQYKVGGAVVFWGVAVYEKDGWVGIRQVGGGLDEAPAALVSADAT